MTNAIRTTAPTPLAPIPFGIPQAFQTRLENGLKVVMFEDDRLPLVSYRLAFLSGDANDPTDWVGLTSAMASMLTEGTDQYSSRELAEKIERLGASISANSSDDFTLVAGSALSMYGSDILQLIEEIVLRPTFPENELDLFRRNTIENLKFQRSQPGFLANEQVARALYGEHPYSRISPTEYDIEKLTREKLEEFHRQALIPNNAIFLAVGDINQKSLLMEIEDRFGGWQAGEPPKAIIEPIRTLERSSLTIVDRPGSAQANIVLANHLFERNHPDYFPVLVMNQILGAGASSRIFMNLREEKGYTYGAYTRIDTKRFAGDIEATAEVRTAVTGDSLKEFFYELNRIRDEIVPEEELADAKNFLTGVFPIRAETQEGLATLVVNQQLYGLPDDYLQTYRENVDAVTSDDVLRAAQNYIRPDAMAIVVVGDAADIIPQARNYSPEIAVFDTNNNSIDVSSFDINASTDEPADASGNWTLSLDFQGQKVPVTLRMEQKGRTISGTIETGLGNGQIKDGTVTGSKFSALAITEIQGQPVEFAINAAVNGDSLSGTLSSAMIPDSLSFSGSRAATLKTNS